MSVFTFSLSVCRVYSRINLVQHYSQIPVDDINLPQRVIPASFGLFKFVRMAFGLSGGA